MKIKTLIKEAAKQSINCGSCNTCRFEGKKNLTIIERCGCILNKLEERGMKYNSIWDMTMVIKEKLKEIQKTMNH